MGVKDFRTWWDAQGKDGRLQVIVQEILEELASGVESVEITIAAEAWEACAGVYRARVGVLLAAVGERSTCQCGKETWLVEDDSHNIVAFGEDGELHNCGGEHDYLP